jgi:pre-60S factor REI1
MRTVHSFYVPEKGLIDAKGLFSYVQEKICRHATCLYCHRRFGTPEAARAHMAAKGHAKLNFHDEGSLLLEYARYYDFADGGSGRCWLAATQRARRHMRVDALGEMVLPSGRSLGHRGLLQAYRQKHGGGAEDTRVSVQAARAYYRHARVTQLATRAGRLEAKVALRAEEKRRHQLLISSFAFAKGTSKALASSYVHKADFADNKHARAITHHGYGGFGGGAHYTMAGSKQFQKGVRVKGVISRHSVQGARLGGARRAKAASRSGGAASSSS